MNGVKRAVSPSETTISAIRDGAIRWRGGVAARKLKGGLRPPFSSSNWIIFSSGNKPWLEEKKISLCMLPTGSDG